VKIEKVVYGGKGIGRLEGKVCFVEGVIPGEEVDVEITKDTKKFSEARVKTIAEKSSSRVEPPCDYYSTCGGCQYQHMEYAEELLVKESQVRDMFSHNLKIDDGIVQKIQSCSEDGYRYRNHVTLRPSDKGRLGYIARDNVSSVLVDDCLIADKNLKPVYQEKVKSPKKTQRITFNLSQHDEVVSSLESKRYLIYLCDTEVWAVSDGFFQNNLKVTELVIKQLKQWVKEINPEGFFDLYAGVGTFSLFAAEKAKELICVEESKPSVECLKKNMLKYRKNKWKVSRGKVEKNFMSLASDVDAKDYMVFLDPPRAGIHNSLAQFFAEHSPFKAISYLSCDPATLVRDLKIITSTGKYVVDSVIPFDMFPRTKHIEALVLLRPLSSRT